LFIISKPVVYFSTDYINQGHRYNIFEGVGCQPFTYNTWVSYVLITAPPMVIGLFSAYYATRSILSFNKSRTQFNEFLSNHTNLTSSRYFRLMCLAALEIIGTIPFSILSMIFNIRNGVRPWKSWEDTHSYFNRVDQYPALLWRQNSNSVFVMELARWIIVACALLFFLFFGFAEEARNQYRKAISSLTKTLGITSFTFSSTSSGGVLSSDAVFKVKSGSGGKIRPGAPVFVHKEMYNRDSTLSMDVSFNDAGGLLSEKKDDEKSSTFAPTLSYGAMTLNDAGGTLSDVGGTLPDYSECPITSIPSSGPASILIPTPAVTRQNSTHNIEISSLRRASITPISPVIDSATAHKAHTSDVV
jgi:pheromone a factor receptor